MTKFKDKTDLSAIKNMAHIFNEFDLEFLDYSLVNHPFIDSIFYPSNTKDKNGIPKLLDMHKPKDVLKVKKLINHQIDKIKDYSHFQFIMNKRYASAFFKYTYEYLDKEDFKSALLNLFTYLEYPNMDANFTQKQFIHLFKRLTPIEWIDPEDLDHYNNLPDIITVYRGIKPKGTLKALSWTDDLTVAQWFANRFEQNGTVYQAHIPKSAILVYTNQRNESECILDFTQLTDIKEMTLNE